MNTKNIIAALTMACGLCSCSDLIDIYPVENNFTDAFYSSETEVNQAIMGVYARLGRNDGNYDFPTIYYFMASEGRSDNLYYATLANAQRDQVDFRNFAVTDVTSTNEDIYARLYQIINDANMLLQESSEEYTRYRAEACFLRALAYFELVRAYGAQPVIDSPITSEEAKTKERQPLSDVYDLIISDLEYAGNNLETFYTGDDAGRVGSIAAKCLLGEVYVTMAGYPMNDSGAYQKAETTLAPIMDDVMERFASNYADIFDVNQENTYDLFSVQFASGNQGLGSSLAAYVTNGSGGIIIPEWWYSGYNQQGEDFRVDTLLVKDMKLEGDKRLETSATEGYWSTTSHGYTTEDSALYYKERCMMIKFLVKDNTNETMKAWNDSPLNFPILRPADACLLYAEALLNNGKASQALTWINVIRNRAGIDELSTNPTMDDIMEERRREFIGEGKRYFDLVRMGEETFLETLKDFSDHYGHVSKMGANNPSEKDLLLPIPLTVMNIQTSWENNTGY
ncbi:MAG: RagB/SusD family nutrient uptake outer membrane protein [Bacteroides sp.]|nr:RagB/SusD family nutrient uptake outer membrane protein [Bacteroides sp.]